MSSDFFLAIAVDGFYTFRKNEKEAFHMKRLPASFPLLIQAIADAHHDGYLYGITKRLRVSPSVPDRWAKGLTKLPKPDGIRRLCAEYDLEFARVWDVIMRDYEAYTRGELVPIPHSADHPGPRRSPDSVRGRRLLRRMAPIAGACDGLAALTGYYVASVRRLAGRIYHAWGLPHGDALAPCPA
jgi:hypothetical protein